MAPDLLTGVHRAEEALFLLIGRVGQHHRCPHPNADRVDVEVVVGHPGGPQLSVDNGLQPTTGQAQPAQALRELDESQPPVELGSPELKLVDLIGRDIGHQLPGHVADLCFIDLDHGSTPGSLVGTRLDPGRGEPTQRLPAAPNWGSGDGVAIEGELARHLRVRLRLHVTLVALVPLVTGERVILDDETLIIGPG